MDKAWLSGKQVFFLLCLFELGTMTLGVGGRAGWLTCLVLGAAAAVLSLLLLPLRGREPADVLRRLAGRRLGPVLAVALSLCGPVAAGRAMREAVDLWVLAGLEAHEWTALLALSAVLLWLTALDVEALGRAAWLCWLPAAGLLALTLALAVPQARWSALRPLPEGLWAEVLARGRQPAADLLLPLPLCLLALAPHVRGKPHLPALGAAGCAFGLAALGAARNTAVLGAALVERLRAPTYFAATVLEPGKLGLLVLAAYLAALPFRAALPLRLARRVLGALWPAAPRPWPLVLAGLSLAAAFVF